VQRLQGFGGMYLGREAVHIGGVPEALDGAIKPVKGKGPSMLWVLGCKGLG
jgi:hypothetical protein